MFKQKIKTGDILYFKDIDIFYFKGLKYLAQLSEQT